MCAVGRNDTTCTVWRTDRPEAKLSYTDQERSGFWIVHKYEFLAGRA
eukprot:COSAG02_NODE_6717_length_3403_cov_2.250908_1_plen_47_part_00